MRILHILDHSVPLHSGYAFRTWAILEQQRRMGWETLHVTSPKHKTNVLEEEVDGTKFYRTMNGRSIAARIPALKQWTVVAALEKRLLELARETQPDLLHAHSPALNGIAAVRVGRKLDLPVVYEVRAFWEDAAVDHGTSREWGLRYRLTRGMETWVLRHAAGVTTICEGLRQDILGRGIPGEKVAVVPNAVDISSFGVRQPRDTNLAQAIGLDGGPVLGFIGSFYAYEGLDLLLRAVAQIREAHPDVKVLLVGGGPQEQRLRSLAGQLELDNTVIFTGRVPHGRVRTYYELVDIFVYPRLSMRLTELVTPLKPLEAMAQGRVVVASDVGGHRELIRPDDTGLLFRAGDEDDLAAVVTRLLDEKGCWQRLTQAGRRFVEEERSWPTAVARYGKIYDLARSGAES